jgi:transcriptional regulator with XRE-family HTH domain
MTAYLPVGQTPVAQSTLSTWERGGVVPRFDDPQLIAISAVLDIDPGELRSSYEESEIQAVEDIAAQCDEELALCTEQFMTSIGKMNLLTITLIGPTELPMAESPRLQDLWCANLKAGVKYRLLLFLDELEEDDLRLIFRALESLSDLLPEKSQGAGVPRIGNVDLVPLLLDSEEFATREIQSLYCRLSSRLSKHAAEMVNARSNILALPAELRGAISRHWCKYGVVALYDPGTSTAPIANFCGRMKLLKTPHGDPMHAFFWLLKDDARKLQALIDRLIEEVEAITGSINKVNVGVSRHG